MRKNLFVSLLVIFLFGFMGCSKSTDQSAAGNATGATAPNAAGANATAPAPGANPSASNTSTSQATQPEPPPPPPPLVLRADTRIPVRLIDTISSARNQSGDTFMASLDADLVSDGTVVFPRNSKVEGVVTRAVASGRLKTPAELAVTLTRITAPDGRSARIETNVIGERAKSHNKHNAELIGGGAGVGALIGAIAGKGKGAAIGALVGAGAGTGGAYATGKKDISFASESRLTFRLRNDLTVPR